MEMRELGTSGLRTPRLVLGGNVFGWTADKATSFAILDAFVAGGGTMIDTADIYSGWVAGNHGRDSEEIIGEWLRRRGRRDDVLIATKTGIVLADDSIDLSPARIAAEAEKSLKTLGTDHIDLYYAHRDDRAVPQEQSLAAFDALVKAGKVRALGASNFTADRLSEALAIADRDGLTPYTVVQPEYNLVARTVFEGPLQQLAIDRNIGVLPYYALASGFLTGKYRDASDAEGQTRGGAASKYLASGGLRVIEAMDAVAGETGATHARIALAWTAAQPGVTAPIASATSVAQVEDLLGAMRLDLTPAQIAALDEAGR